jgi:predicted nucleotidyltransferase
MRSMSEQVSVTDDAAMERMRAIAAATAGLDLMVLFGSRARGDAHEGSDWDIGYMGDGSPDPLELRAQLVTALGTEAIDVVDLARASGLVRFRAARDGRLIFERVPGGFLDYAETVALFWCDVEPVVRAAHEQTLRELGS